MNILAVDIGNTNISIGYSLNASWVEHWSLASSEQRSADEYRIIFSMLFQNARSDISATDLVALCSVVPNKVAAIHAALQDIFSIQTIIISTNIKHGLVEPISPEIGNDLLSNAVAAYHSYHCDCIIVDSGTALTCTAVSAQGKILGVSIFPGIQSSLLTLGTSTAQLPTLDMAYSSNAFGKDSRGAIHAGISLGYTGIIREISGRMKGEMSADTKVIGTGGDIYIIHEHDPSLFSILDPWHTLSGIRQLALLNKP